MHEKMINFSQKNQLFTDTSVICLLCQMRYELGATVSVKAVHKTLIYLERTSNSTSLV